MSRRRDAEARGEALAARRPDPQTRRRFERARDATLAEPSLLASPRLSALLSHLVARALDGERGPLDAARVATEVLGRSPTSDPRHDPALRVLLGRLRRVLDERCARVADAPVLRLPPRSHHLLLERAPAPTSRDGAADGAGANEGGGGERTTRD